MTAVGNSEAEQGRPRRRPLVPLVRDSVQSVFDFVGEYMYSYCVLDKLDMYVYLLLLNKKVWDALLLRIFPFGAWTPQRGTP